MTAGDGCQGPEGEEGRANARLIAAAPDLLALVKAVLVPPEFGPIECDNVGKENWFDMRDRVLANL